MWLTVLNKMPNISDYQQHQLLWGFFRQQDAKQRPFCFRDTGDEILVLSSVKPSTESREIKFERGQTLMFELRMSIGKSGSSRKNPDALSPHQWSADEIKRRFINILDDVADVDFVTFKKNSVPHVVVKNDGHKMYFNQTMFYGTLTVKDPQRFDKKISHGIGRGCAFGFGAMMLPQVMK